MTDEAMVASPSGACSNGGEATMPTPRAITPQPQAQYWRLGNLLKISSLER